MPSPMIASVAITCAARTITFTPDTSAAWRSYAEANTMPLYLPAADSPIELSGCDPYIVTIEPSAQAATEGWAFQIPGETARHARLYHMSADQIEEELIWGEGGLVEAQEAMDHFALMLEDGNPDRKLGEVRPAVAMSTGGPPCPH